MNKINAALSKIPKLLASKTSIFIFLFLFAYLVVYALLCAIIPALSPYSPSSDVQLILGNYTNVLSALGASIAAGAGTAVHASVQKLHKRHDALEAHITSLHEKVDQLTKESKK